MCGIVYSKSLVGKPVNKTIASRYLAQRSRGTDGFGFYIPETNRLTHNVREGRILSLLRRNKKATEILFHHRMPTSTANVRNACHPFSTKDYFEHNYVGVHNGVLWNEAELRSQHEKLGIDYVSEQLNGDYNDSEALIYDIARYIEGEVDHLTAEGTIAFIVIQRDKKTGEAKAVFFGRNDGNPLMMKKTKKSFTLSSEGEGEAIKPNTMYCYNYDTGVISMSPCRIPSYTSSGGNFGVAYSRRGATPNWNDPNYSWEDDYDDIGEHNRRFGLDEHGNTLSSSELSKAARDFFGGQDHAEAMEQYVESQVDDLLTQTQGDVVWALELARQELKRVQTREETLENKIEGLQNATEQEQDEYWGLGDKRYFIQETIKRLERGLSGNNQMGFHYTPDSETYGSPGYTLDRHGKLKDLRKERVDPITGFLYYPYAD